MGTILKKIYFIVVLLMPCTMLTAQIKTDIVPDAPGKIIRKQNTGSFLNSFKILSATKVSSLANTADKVMDIICQSHLLNPPIGYNAKIIASASDLGLREKEPAMAIYCQLKYLTRDSRYKEIQESMGGADLTLKINPFDFFHQMGNYWQDCNKLKFPLFFEEPPLTDSTNDYIEFQYKGGPLRIVTAGSKPLFIPLTRKEFLQFLVKNNTRAADDNKASLKSTREGQEVIKKMMASQNESDRAYSASTLKSMDYSIELILENIKQIEQELANCKSLLGSMSVQDANTPARLDYSKKREGYGMAALDRLAPAGRREGVMLVKLNPDFYNRSPSAPVAQMMVLYYEWATAGVAKDPDYIQQAVLDIFKNMDYHALRESMK